MFLTDDPVQVARQICDRKRLIRVHNKSSCLQTITDHFRRNPKVTTDGAG
jgi:hypothetical protein